MDTTSKIYIAGHRGLVGSAIVKTLQQKGYTQLLRRDHSRLDLTSQAATDDFFAREKPEYVVLAAARVGSIQANNTCRAQFIYENLQIQNNVIHCSYLHGVKKLLFLGSTCIYPREAPQPITEQALLTAPLEYTNEPYAIAKIAGLKMCESYNLQYGTNFLSVMPTNLYGYHDNFDLERGHVVPALIRKMYLARLLSEGNEEGLLQDLGAHSLQEAKERLGQFGIDEKRVEIWGDGSPRREFLWSEDLADACVYLFAGCNFADLCSGEQTRNTHINIGTGKDLSIRELALLIREITGFSGRLEFNTAKPNGTMRKLTDCTRLHQLGWRHKTEIEEGVEKLYRWYANGANG